MIYRKAKKGLAALLTAVLILGLRGCGLVNKADPHAGMVSVADGRGGEMWVALYENIEKASFSAEEFFSDGSFVGYSGSEFEALRGIDVSEHQQEIDWQAVKADGIDFAIIRAGYRGYQQGSLNEDMFFRKNIEGALAAGIRVGVYFFSQAVNTDEAAAEAQYCLALISSYDVTLPVFYDWENIGNGETARTDSLDGKIVTDCCLAFAKTIQDSGYKAGVYFYRSQGYQFYNLEALKELEFWSAAVGSYPDFYYKHGFWQYSFSGRVNGIAADCDLNLMFVPRTETDKN